MRDQLARRPWNGRGSYLFSLGLILLILVILVLIGLPGMQRVRRDVEDQACIENLVRIATAKEHYVLDHELKAGAPVTLDELIQNKYLPARPPCPLHGTYQANAAGALPTCSVGHGHVLPIKQKQAAQP